MGIETISVELKKLIIIDFLQKCNEYSEQKLLTYSDVLINLSEKDKEGIQQKIHDWECYCDFNDFAISELKGEELDDWF
jgi:hypothetical protein